jgi:hypothetical protein
MEQLIKKIQKLREWEHLGLITTTGHTSDKGLNEFLFELEREALVLAPVSNRRELLIAFEQWKLDGDVKNLLPDQVVDWYLKSN